MRVVIASGKGGTGKTTVATNLARTAARLGRSVAYVDCDVEEPNGHIFLAPEVLSRAKVECRVPSVDAEVCTLCGMCGEICQFSAIAKVGSQILCYPELCHSCGGCSLVCPTGAIRERSREIGEVEIGVADGVQVVQGRLNVGEAQAVPVIRGVRARVPDADIVIFDAPPGTACTAVESVRACDYLVLVTEPTPFGLHDLKLAVEMAFSLEVPFGIFINQADLGDARVHAYCARCALRLLGEMPSDRRVAQAYARGAIACDALPEYAPLFEQLLDRILDRESAQ